MKLSSLVHFIEGKRGGLLFHSTSLFQLYLNSRTSNLLFKALENNHLSEQHLLEILQKNRISDPAGLVSQLLSNKYIISSDDEDRKAIQRVKEDFGDLPYLTVLYVVLGKACNLECSYCFVGPSPPPPFSSQFSLAENRNAFKKALSLLPESSDKLTILFYGGEPLIFLEQMKKTTSFLRKRLADKKDLEFVVTTNGTLINKTTAKWLHDNEISVGVSIDGAETSHNAHRKYKDGRGSYEDVLRGFKMLRDAGNEASISFTVSAANIDGLWDNLVHIVKQFSPTAMVFNPLRASAHGKDYGGPDYPEKFARIAYEGWKYLRNQGISEGRCLRIIRSLAERKPRYSDCAACGNQLVLLPGSEFSICQGLISHKKHTYTLDEWNGRLSEDLKEWSLRSPLNMPECYGCIALGACGGGCPCRLIAKGSSMWSLDGQHCTFAKHIVNSFLREVCEEKEQQLAKGGVFMAEMKIEDLPRDQKISKEEMRRVLGGSMPVPLPYQPSRWYSSTRVSPSYWFLTPEND